MKKLDAYLTKPKEERTLRDYIADAAAITLMVAMGVLFFLARYGII